MTLEEHIAEGLTASGRTVAVAESCTGGRLASRLTALPGSSGYFQGGVIAYRDSVKTGLLGVPAALIRRRGAVSEEVAGSMARAVCERLNADFGIGITGISGPGGGTRSKPVGTTFIAVATGEETLTAHCRFSGERAQNQRQAAHTALRLLGEFLE